MFGFARFTFFLLVTFTLSGASLVMPQNCKNGNGSGACTTNAGNDTSGSLFNDTTSTEIQIDFVAADFAADGCTTSCTLSSISFRTAAGLGIGSAVDVGNVSVYLSSVTSGEANGNLSSTFATNVGSSQNLVYSGALTLASTPSGNTPSPFDLTINFTTPYTYTSTSDLLFEIVWNGSKTAYGANEDGTDNTRGLTGTPGSNFAVIGSASSSTGTVSSVRYVAQFNTTTAPSVPEPTSFALFATGGLALYGFRRKYLSRDGGTLRQQKPGPGVSGTLDRGLPRISR